MKRAYFAVLLLLIAGISYSQHVSVAESSENSLTLRFVLEEYSFGEVTTPRGSAFVPLISHSSNNYVKGAPDLPSFVQAIAIPNQGGFTVEVKSSACETIQGIDIAPFKGAVYRNENPDDIPYIYGEAYNQNSFLPEELSIAGEPYILRDVRGSNIEFRPFVYNAVSKELKVYKEIVVELKFNNDKAANEISDAKKARKRNKEFEQIYSRLFLNAGSIAKYNVLEEPTPGKILVIAHDKYIDVMDDYIRWKRQKGIDAELIAAGTIAETLTSGLLKTYIRERYNADEDLCYFLLVGDAGDIPTTVNSFGDSDYTYVCLKGADAYADAFIGRFSGSNLTDIRTQVERTIHYERSLGESDTWLARAFGSASRQGAGQGHNRESDVQHLNIIKADLESFGYTVTHVNEAGGTNSAISAAFNEGVGIANYIGHGNNQVWQNTYFNNSYVNNLTNDNKLPFIWSVACLNGNFRPTTCFAEAWLRATDDEGNPTGAIAFLGATINQTWKEPMDAQDEMVDILTGGYPDNVKRTIGGLSFNGMFKMIENGGDGEVMAYTWVLFGDPSLAVRTAVPSAMAISHPSAVVIGMDTFDIECDADGALACLSLEDEEGNVAILSRAYVENGIAQLPIDFDVQETLTLTVTAYNKETVQKAIPVNYADGPYVVQNGFGITDADGNNDGLADYGERIVIRQSLKNIGQVAAENLTLGVAVDNPLVTVSEGRATIEYIDALSEIMVEDAFSLIIPKVIADQTLFNVSLTITDNNENVWKGSYPITVNSPIVEFVGGRADDRTGGNANWVADNGETVQLYFNFSNTGSTELRGKAYLMSESEYVQVLNNTCETSVPAGETGSICFDVEVDDDVPAEIEALEFTVFLASTIESYAYSFPVNVLMEGWESNDFSLFEWENTSEVPWVITDSEKYEGLYSLKSGTIANRESTTLSLTVEVKDDDTIAFYKKVSCEQPSTSSKEAAFRDNLAFYIDGEKVGQWGGNIDWSLESYEVKAGQREFRWEYSKDNAMGEGRDCAWIDNIKLPAAFDPLSISTPAMAANQLKVYPNPARDYLNVLLHEGKEKEESRIRILDMNGRIIAEYNTVLQPGVPFRINIGFLDAGYYTVSVNSKQLAVSSKTVISKQ